MVRWITTLLSTLQQHTSQSSTADFQDILPLDVLREVIKPQIEVTDPYMYVSRIMPPTTPVRLHYDKYGLAWFTGRYDGTLAHTIFSVSLNAGTNQNAETD